MINITELSADFIEQEIVIRGLRYPIVIKKTGMVDVGCVQTTVIDIVNYTGEMVLAIESTKQADADWWEANKAAVVAIVQAVYEKQSAYWNVEDQPNRIADVELLSQNNYAIENSDPLINRVVKVD